MISPLSPSSSKSVEDYVHRDLLRAFSKLTGLYRSGHLYYQVDVPESQGVYRFLQQMSQLEPTTSSFNLFDKPLENEIIIVTIRTACLLTLAVIAETNENFTYANKTYQQVLTELEILSEEIKKTLATQQTACTSRTSLSSSMKLGKSSQSLRDLIAEEASDRLKELKLGTRKCAQCGTRAMTMPKCSRCHRTFYCKVECQRTHFPTHKLSCSQAPMSASSSSSSSSATPTLPVIATTSTTTATTTAIPTSTSVPTSEITPTMEVEDDNESTTTTNSATSSSTTSPSNSKTRGTKKKSKRKSGRNRK